MLDAIPCRLCGYDAPEARCPHCDLAPRDPSIRGLGGPIAGFAAGLRAVPVGLWLLARTRGVKRFLVPPLVLTSLCFIAIFLWIQGWVTRLLEAVTADDLDRLGLEPGWARSVLEWLMARQVVLWLAQASGWVIAIVTSSLIALWTFSIAYEAIAGPFLDEIQGRLEKRWFGSNPRDELQRPTDIPARICAWITTVAGLPAGALVLAWFFGSGTWTWWALGAAPLPYLVAAAVNREYGLWLWWVVRIESGTLWVSIKASIVAGTLLVFFLWLKFVPLVGFWLFAAVAGFTTAVSLLDIPFSRRQWPLRMRLRFLGQHFAPVTAYGAVAGLLFLVPVLGPALMVPAASVGGLWLLVLLDKDRLRPPDRRAEGPGRPPPRA